MSLLFFSLRGVPDDEADEVRELLQDHDIEFYETPPGNWGISLPALWLYEVDDLPRARELFDSYQQQRAISQRALYLELQRQGQRPGFWRHNLSQPLRLFSYSLALLLLAYVSIKWLYELGL